MRRKVGVAAVKSRVEEKEKYTKVGTALETEKISSVRETLEAFKTNLTEFARKHKTRINEDPEFRQQFHTMCVSVGVDPLASAKGFWADLLGIGDFYYELSVKILQICLQTRNENGGILAFNELMRRLRLLSSQQGHSGAAINKEDVYRALEKVQVLGNGIKLVTLPSREKIVLSIPMELNMDHEAMINFAFENNGCVEEQLFLRSQNWSKERFQRVIKPLLEESAVWIDNYNGQTFYFFTSCWNQSTQEESIL